ncbi:hypothetical protein [Ruegeria conchae]|uniref:hypothetical protein n=1 Tax=Ruegeria conchae TaxID=981384 RepID=UPI001C7CCC4B|nr:hypothetical protein [Ruegeria conchae]
MGETHWAGSCLTIGPLIGSHAGQGNLRFRPFKQFLASAFGQALFAGFAPLAIAAIDSLDRHAALMSRAFKAGSALRTGFFTQKPAGA